MTEDETLPDFVADEATIPADELDTDPVADDETRTVPDPPQDDGQ